MPHISFEANANVGSVITFSASASKPWVQDGENPPALEGEHEVGTVLSVMLSEVGPDTVGVFYLVETPLGYHYEVEEAGGVTLRF